MTLTKENLEAFNVVNGLQCLHNVQNSHTLFPGVPILTSITGNSVIVMNLASGHCILHNIPASGGQCGEPFCP
jgi:hypothetical protein